jgi:hypothetical protein
MVGSRCSRPGNGQEVEAERGWEEVRKMMAEACSGGSGGASTHLSGHGNPCSLPAAPLPSQARAINPADVDSKGPVKGPVGAGMPSPPDPPTHLEGQGGGGAGGWVGVGLLKRLRTYWLGESMTHTKRTRMRHDEVCVCVALCVRLVGRGEWRRGGGERGGGMGGRRGVVAKHAAN